MSILKRLGNVLLVGVILFITLAVMHKLLMKDEDWLYASAMWTIFWMIGSFIAKSFNETNSGIKETIQYNVILIFLVFVVSAFVVGVLLDKSTWLKIVAEITIPFGMSLLVNSKWKSD